MKKIIEKEDLILYKCEIDNKAILTIFDYVYNCCEEERIVKRWIFNSVKEAKIFIKQLFENDLHQEEFNKIYDKEGKFNEK